MKPLVCTVFVWLLVSAAAVVNPPTQANQDRGRRLSIGHVFNSAGEAAYIPVEFRGQGGERSVSFSLQLPPPFRYVRTDLGSTTQSDAQLTTDTRFIQTGYLGVEVDSQQGFLPGRSIVLYVIVQAHLPQQNISFSNVPVPIDVRGSSGETLPVVTSVGSLTNGISDPDVMIAAPDLGISEGQRFEVPINLRSAQGGFDRTNSIDFSLNWDPQIFDYATARIGSVVPTGVALTLDTSLTHVGKLGVRLNGGSEYVNFTEYELLLLSLDPKPNILAGFYAISFGDSPIRMRLGNPDGTQLSYGWRPGFVRVGPPPTPVARISGRVLTPNFYAVQNTPVTLTNHRGDRFTRTTSLTGSFTFTDMPHGTYTLRVVSKRYRIPSRVITVTGDVTGLSLEALE